MACAMPVADSLATVIVAQCADNGGHRGSGAVMSDPGLVGERVGMVLLLLLLLTLMLMGEALTMATDVIRCVTGPR